MHFADFPVTRFGSVELFSVPAVSKLAVVLRFSKTIEDFEKPH